MSNLTTAHRAFLCGNRLPLRIKGLCRAGATQAIAIGDIVTFNYVSGYWSPIAADQPYFGQIGIADQEIASGDLAGYRWIVVPRPGDVFRYPLASASAIVENASVYYSAAQVVAASGTYPIGRIVDPENYPNIQRSLSKGEIGDEGTTVRSTGYANVAFLPEASYWFSMNPASFSFGNVCTAAGAEDEVVIPQMPFACRVINAWGNSRDTNNVNITLKNGSTNAFTAATAKGGTDHAMFQFNSIDAYTTFARGGQLVAGFSGIGVAEICVTCIPA